MIEINLPPIRFERVGTPGFYLSWVRPAIFATALVTNTDSSVLRQDTYNVGTQIDLRFTIMSRLDMTLSWLYGGFRWWSKFCRRVHVVAENHVATMSLRTE